MNDILLMTFTLLLLMSSDIRRLFIYTFKYISEAYGGQIRERYPGYVELGSSCRPLDLQLCFFRVHAYDRFLSKLGENYTLTLREKQFFVCSSVWSTADCDKHQYLLVYSSACSVSCSSHFIVIMLCQIQQNLVFHSVPQI